MRTLQIPRRHLTDILLGNEWSLDTCLLIIQEENPTVKPEHVPLIERHLRRNFVPKLKRKWESVYRNRLAFDATHADWLNGTCGINLDDDDEDQTDSDLETPTVSSSGGRGRPKRSFSDSGRRTQQRRVKELREDVDPELLRSAAMPRRFSPEEGLALMLDLSLSKYQYQYLRLAAKKLGSDIFPTYNELRLMKIQCYPDNVEITESSASVKLEALLHHTAVRLLESLPESTLRIMESQLTLVLKWGCDGSSGHSAYKQLFSDGRVSDGSLFMSCIVPLRIHSALEDKTTYWDNPRPSSPRFCRPIKFEFIKETEAVIKAEVQRVESEIATLRCAIVQVKDKSFIVEFKMLLSMIDGKVLQYINDVTGCVTCPICGANPKDMNNIDQILERIPTARYSSMSPLHARIKFMECILNISYCLPYGEWATRDKAKQKIKKETKEKIQHEFNRRLGLKVDVVRQGMGTANDGNTSRRFFASARLCAEITGIDENMIMRFATILNAINCTEQLDVDKFRAYCIDTARLYADLYSWYPMPNTVHKVLIHGSQMITEAFLPIGMLSEEAQEAQNKVYRQQRRYHSRKTGRSATNEDVIHIMLAGSDPVMNNFRKEPRFDTSVIDSNVLPLLEGDEVADPSFE